jgi:hypothetical protein
VSIEGALDDYGVVIDPTTMAVDVAKTHAVREQRRLVRAATPSVMRVS